MKIKCPDCGSTEYFEFDIEYDCRHFYRCNACSHSWILDTELLHSVFVSGWDDGWLAGQDAQINTKNKHDREQDFKDMLKDLLEAKE